MKSTSTVYGLLLCVLTSLTAWAGSTRVTSVTLCRDVSEPELVPIDIAEVFDTQAPAIHAIVDLADVKDATVVRSAWISVDAIATPNYEIDAMELKLGRGQERVHFHLSKPHNDWPPGNYKVEVSIDGRLATVKTFQVAAGAAGGAPAAREPSAAGQQTHTPSPPGAPGMTTAPGVWGYSGTYVADVPGNRITLSLSEDSEGVLTGTLSSTTGRRFTIEGQAEEGAAAGVCYDEQGGAFFEAYVDGDQMWFSLIETDEYNMPDYERAQDLNFTRVGDPPATSPTPAAPSRGRTADQGGNTLQGSSHSGRRGGTYRHPVGFSFWYPENWTAKMQESFLQLIPPNPGSSPQGPTEIYGVVGESVASEGIFSPDDPRVLDFLDREIRSISPFVSRTGRASPAETGQGKGVVVDWEGRSPQGETVRARAFVSIIRDHGVALIGIGFKDQLAARDSDLRSMFSSFGFGEGQNDPSLLGSWRLVSVSSIDNQSPFESAWSRAQAVSETQSELVFRPDGTWSRTDKSTTIVGAGDMWLDGSDTSSSQGRWNAGDGLLYMVWDDNSYRECQYRAENAPGGLQLRLVCGGTGETWQKAY